MTKTTFATREDRARAMDTWHVVDASQYVLGKMAVAIAEILMGKNKPLYTPHMQVGDGVIVINADRVRTTGNKAEGRYARKLWIEAVSFSPTLSATKSIHLE